MLINFEYEPGMTVYAALEITQDQQITCPGCNGRGHIIIPRKKIKYRYGCTQCGCTGRSYKYNFNYFVDKAKIVSISTTVADNGQISNTCVTRSIINSQLHSVHIHSIFTNYEDAYKASVISSKRKKVKIPKYKPI